MSELKEAVNKSSAPIRAIIESGSHVLRTHVRCLTSMLNSKEEDMFYRFNARWIKEMTNSIVFMWEYSSVVNWLMWFSHAQLGCSSCNYIDVSGVKHLVDLDASRIAKHPLCTWIYWIWQFLMHFFCLFSFYLYMLLHVKIKHHYCLSSWRESIGIITDDGGWNCYVHGFCESKFR